MNTEFWVAIGEGIAIVLGVIEEVIRNMIMRKKNRKKKRKEEEDIEITLTEGKGEEKDVEERGRALKISVVKKGGERSCD